ncbi:protoporphyrinogen oxidase [Mycolicibacterium komossense]|uniref:Coproporphyrinogen III oxidase n=1 Tax=Mycolicibacterium komossense TaxID=1779 RepID=A0ABT3CHS1_9MYCO|nr:protoporphyrinogen oxidase [Mycolicibacterium komossense]MCV7228927.1 protoporphyrinogen oxidase [Mycolicibacterium komossense]
MKSDGNPTYSIVGGGISGLVAAYRLRSIVGDDAVITLFDPADRLGGILRTERIAGQPMDLGAEAFVVRRPEVPALLRELGLAGRQVGTTGVRPLLYSQSRLHALPAETVNGIPSSAASMAGLVDDQTLSRMAVEPSRPLQWLRGSDPAVAQLVDDRFGAQVVARSVDPMLSGVYAGSAATIGLRSAVPTVAVALDQGATSLTDAVRAALPPSSGAPVFGAIDGGYEVLIRELVVQSGIRWVGTGIEHLAHDSNGWALRDDEGAHWRADAVILALPAPRLARLVGSIAPRTAAAASRITTASSAVVALAVPGGTPLPSRSGVLVASGERLNAKAITLSTRKWGRGGNAELLRLSFGRFGDRIARDTSDEELLAWSVRDLSTVFGVDVEPLDVGVHRWLDAMPQYGPGHAELVAELRAGLPPTLAVAGNYLDGIGVPACVGVAGRAAAEVARMLGADGMAR